MATYPLTEVLADPAKVARDIEHDRIVFGIRDATGKATRYGPAILEMTLHPQAGLLAAGFVPERVRIVVLGLGKDETFAYVLSGRDRAFKHRNLPPSRSLCLFYDRDDPALRWLPEDGLGEYLTIVRRHLVFEEQCRRTGHWPCEDTPHGPAEHGPHPVRTREMRALARRWSRSAA